MMMMVVMTVMMMIKMMMTKILMKTIDWCFLLALRRGSPDPAGPTRQAHQPEQNHDDDGDDDDDGDADGDDENECSTTCGGLSLARCSTAV